MKALIITDMQNDFMPWGALPVKGGNEIIRTIFELTSHFKHVFATFDWHPVDHVSFALNHGKRPGTVIRVHNQDQILWPEHCVQDTLGADLVGPLHKIKIEKIFHKGTDSFIDSYSTFFDNERKKSNGLSEYLKKKKIKDLYFVGVATDYCIKYSVLDALREGFKATVIKDACRPINLKPDDEIEALKEMELKGAKIITSDQITK